MKTPGKQKIRMGMVLAAEKALLLVLCIAMLQL